MNEEETLKNKGKSAMNTKLTNFISSFGSFEALSFEATRLLRGFGGMLPREFFLKWCVLEKNL